jgi:hypothetical protein
MNKSTKKWELSAKWKRIVDGREEGAVEVDKEEDEERS